MSAQLQPGPPQRPGEGLGLPTAGRVLEVDEAIAVVVQAVAADLCRGGDRRRRAARAIDAAAVGGAGEGAPRARPAAQVVAVADLAALVVDHAVAALQLAVGVAAVAVGGVAVVALLVAIEHAVTHRLDAAVRRAAVAALRVAVVALLAGIEPAISTARWGGRSLRGAWTGGERAAAAAGEERAARRRAGDVAVAHLAGIDDAIAAHGPGGQRRGGR